MTKNHNLPGILIQLEIGSCYFLWKKKQKEKFLLKEEINGHPALKTKFLFFGHDKYLVVTNGIINELLDALLVFKCKNKYLPSVLEDCYQSF